jgi:hypothetical protein
MNQVFIDNSLILLSLICAIIVTKALKQRKTGPFFSTLLLFPSLLIFLNMWAHTVAVIITNIKRFNAGTFQYNFTVYSYLLFGFTFIVLSGFSIHYSKKYIQGEATQILGIYLLNLLTAILFIPVGFINPIGFLPVLASIFSSLVLLYKPFKQKQSTSYRVIEFQEKGIPQIQ